MKLYMTAIVGFLAIALSGCGEPLSKEEKAQLAQKSANLIVETDILGYVDYVIDSRSGICFARSAQGRGYYVYSPVACTEKVKSLLVNTPELLIHHDKEIIR